MSAAAANLHAGNTVRVQVRGTTASATDCASAGAPGVLRRRPLPPVRMRAGVQDDHALVVATWMRHYRRSDAAKAIDERVYQVEQRIVVADCLARSELVCVVDPLDPAIVLAYAVREGPGMHWLHTKDGFRRLGLARMLVDALSATGPLCWYTHDARHAVEVGAALGLRHNPYRVRP